MTLKSARGHSYRAVELACSNWLRTALPLNLLTTHRFGLAKSITPSSRSAGKARRAPFTCP
jgi:hypothetical protein